MARTRLPKKLSSSNPFSSVDGNLDEKEAIVCRITGLQEPQEISHESCENGFYPDLFLLWTWCVHGCVREVLNYSLFWDNLGQFGTGVGKQEATSDRMPLSPPPPRRSTSCISSRSRRGTFHPARSWERWNRASSVLIVDAFPTTDPPTSDSSRNTSARRSTKARR